MGPQTPGEQVMLNNFNYILIMPPRKGIFSIIELMNGGLFSLSHGFPPSSPSLIQVMLLTYALPYTLRRIIGL